jgi:hypothetical protein
MTVLLTLQVPTEDWSGSQILAATADEALIRQFCEAILTERREEAEQLEDPGAREIAQLKVEQVKARIDLALGTKGE